MPDAGGAEEAAAALAERFDPALVPPGQLAQVLRDAGAIEKMMANIASLAAARMAAGRAGGRGRLARRCGSWPRPRACRWPRRPGQWRRPGQLEAQPEVAAAARAGGLSRPQLALVAGAVARRPGPLPELLALAQTGLAERAGRRGGPGPGRPGRPRGPAPGRAPGPGPAGLHRRRRHRPPARPGPARGRGPGHGRHRPPGRPGLCPGP